MAGSFLSVDSLGANTHAAVLNRIVADFGNLEPTLREIGEYLIESTQQRFKDMQSSDGELWEELAPSTIAKKKRVDRILTESGTLADTLNYQLGHNQLLFGSNMEYAASMQFGREDANIPAREFLGFSEDDNDKIIDILSSRFNI